MDINLMTVLAGAFGSLLTYLATTQKHKKDYKLSDRLQLSKEQYQLIEELKDMISTQQAEIDKLKIEIKELQVTNSDLLIANSLLKNDLARLNQKFDEI
jgi:predicted nuclease with TOPRIM domain